MRTYNYFLCLLIFLSSCIQAVFPRSYEASNYKQRGADRNERQDSASDPDAWSYQQRDDEKPYESYAPSGELRRGGHSPGAREPRYQQTREDHYYAPSNEVKADSSGSRYRPASAAVSSLRARSAVADDSEPSVGAAEEEDEEEVEIEGDDRKDKRDAVAQETVGIMYDENEPEGAEDTQQREARSADEEEESEKGMDEGLERESRGTAVKEENAILVKRAKATTAAPIALSEENARALRDSLAQLSGDVQQVARIKAILDGAGLLAAPSSQQATAKGGSAPYASSSSQEKNLRRKRNEEKTAKVVAVGERDAVEKAADGDVVMTGNQSPLVARDVSSEVADIREKVKRAADAGRTTLLDVEDAYLGGGAAFEDSLKPLVRRRRDVLPEATGEHKSVNQTEQVHQETEREASGAAELQHHLLTGVSEGGGNSEPVVVDVKDLESLYNKIKVSNSNGKVVKKRNPVATEDVSLAPKVSVDVRDKKVAGEASATVNHGHVRRRRSLVRNPNDFEADFEANDSTGVRFERQLKMDVDTDRQGYEDDRELQYLLGKRSVGRKGKESPPVDETFEYFGPLPRTYKGRLPRYKRIKRTYPDGSSR